ncbi:MAG: hypothetical protein ABIE07_02405 [Candidatus Zixiibacteriota bacterium]
MSLLVGGILTILSLWLLSYIYARLDIFRYFLVFVPEIVLSIPFAVTGYLCGLLVDYSSVMGKNRNMPLATTLAIIFCALCVAIGLFIFYRPGGIIDKFYLFDTFVSHKVYLPLFAFLAFLASIFFACLRVNNLKDKPFCEDCNLWLEKKKMSPSLRLDQLKNLIELSKEGRFKKLNKLIISCPDSGSFCKAEFFKCPKCTTAYYDVYSKKSSKSLELIVSSKVNKEHIQEFTEAYFIDDSHQKIKSIESEDREYEEKRKTTWICSNCGEKVEGQFGTCWNCGADRMN